MKLFISSIILSLFLVSSGMLLAQLDPAAMATLSKLSPDQRQQLINKYGSGGGGGAVSKSVPTASLPNRSIRVEKPEEESFDSRSEFLGDLTRMEIMISKDLSLLLAQEEAEGLSGDNELLEAISENRSLLRKIKVLQRQEMEIRAEEFAKSQTDSVKPFGYNLFASDPSTFAPGNEVPIPAGYRIGPGDMIDVQLFGQRNDSFSLDISREGMLNFPGIGPIHAFEKGTSFLELKNHLKEKIREHLGEGVQSSISLGAFRSIRIFLLGEVRKQGAYTVSALSTTINALLSCGGIKETGSLRTIQLKRAGEVISTLDLYDLLLAGDTSADQPLQPGDVIFVPVVQKQITLSGSVRRPAKYEILGGETLEGVLQLAGGPSDRSVLDMIRLERIDQNYRPVVRNLKFRSSKNEKILPGDQISIGFAGNHVRNVVSLVGETEKAGDFEWKEGLLLTDLISSSEDLNPNVDLDYGLIRRKLNDGSTQCLSFLPRDLFHSVPKEIPLHSQDMVYFFLREPRGEVLGSLLNEMRKQSQAGQFSKIVRVSGAVHFPGEYPFTNSMVLTDLLRAAGGTKDSAYLLDAEITRIGVENGKSALVKHVRVDQSFLTEETKASSFTLSPYDSLSIKPIPLWREGESIEITGEVNFPGTYSIKIGETLLDVIKRAGGLTDRAFPDGAVFSRENLRVKEDEQRERLIAQLEADLATTTLAATDSQEALQAQSAAQAMLSRLRNQKSQGRLVIDLSKILTDREGAGLLVKDRDSLLVPSTPYAVSVSGEVQFPSSHIFQESLDVNDYLNRSGSYTQNADKSRTFVVKANGSVVRQGGNAWFGKSSGIDSISAGDVIVVPIDLKQTRWLENLTYGTQIVYQLAVAAAAVNSF
ncbi:SLBB domain-containing protein [Opitutales bacterium]|nr:SLBB domain-containing protein [Opitutales bacterium]